MTDDTRPTDDPGRPDEAAALDRSLQEASASIEAARTLLAVRRVLGRDVREAIRHLLDAQDRIATEGSSAAAHRDLLEAIRLIGSVEQEFVQPGSTTPPAEPVLRAPVLSAVDSPSDEMRPVGGTFPAEEPAVAGDAAGAGGDDAGGDDADAAPTTSAGDLDEVSGESARESAGDGGGPGARGTSEAPTPDPDELAGDAQNRRAYLRLTAVYQVELEPERRTTRSAIASFPLNGVTVNISRGGMLARIDQGILRHGRYLVRFLGSQGSVKPEITWGAVRRSRARDRGWEVGIEFDSALESVE